MKIRIIKKMISQMTQIQIRICNKVISSRVFATCAIQNILNNHFLFRLFKKLEEIKKSKEVVKKL